jgi:hypothetical protein
MGTMAWFYPTNNVLGRIVDHDKVIGPTILQIILVVQVGIRPYGVDKS